MRIFHILYRVWHTETSTQFKSSHKSRLVGVWLDSPEPTLLDSDLKAFETCLWLDYICFMTWLEFKDGVDLKPWICSLLEESHPQSLSQFATFDVIGQNDQVITHVASFCLIEILRVLKNLMVVDVFSQLPLPNHTTKSCTKSNPSIWSVKKFTYGFSGRLTIPDLAAFSG